ncbi:hypothetical protein L2E82_49282 [Cichorium intybus]|uniref:Uncharacterized protein n=1 Tax=Cichorium intybus TaxID=13427 RepID=A0ACB8Z0U2_CICIN|nr:hypothetical protein L2E82_49282 [Cichorium intybus]
MQSSAAINKNRGLVGQFDYKDQASQSPKPNTPTGGNSRRNEMAERMAYFGLSVNMVAFMFYVMHRPFTSSASAVNNLLGISQASSVLGGFLANAYLGRYRTIALISRKAIKLQIL